ncbi:hypothetical protein M0E82_08430 [Corynebacterium sp. P7202]|uniref:RiboL-PSP-HEPN domain-containing protein n=1 Tax=Corynebacterium pygosceleis TaxID=2800406 RepID=A0A9Q4C9D9_9CORY|nr:hypothetical protein [Corynebacterium pygosceleis]MCK7638020.1 hypothetical protein [Corynebacterium pygosceleis]MCX7468736.1 hypothetical protein [Corynebacterium pygosceleis]
MDEAMWANQLLKPYSLEQITEADPRASLEMPEVQVAIRAARSSAESAIAMANTMNSLRKAAEGKNVQGKFTSEAVDCLRSALLFSGAGLDTALKRLAAEALPSLVDSDDIVSKKFSEFVESRISDESGRVRAKELVRILMAKGETPRAVMVNRWIYELQSNSAQSADRVKEFAAALGVVDSDLRKRIEPKGRKSLLEKAFLARNQIAHELDVTKPRQVDRKKLESIRQYRKRDDIVSFCTELLDVTQCLVNDTVRRMLTG